MTNERQKRSPRSQRKDDAYRTSVSAYLQERQRNLTALQQDIKCRPFSANEEPQLVLAVDWSEVFAYILGIGPSLTASAAAVEDERMVQAVHQVALNVLFDQGPFQQLLLIAPYASEMTYFIERVRHNERALGIATATDEELRRDLEASDSMRELIAMVDEVRRELGAVDFDQLTEYINAQPSRGKTALAWVQKHFREFYLFARIVGGDVLQGLRWLYSAKAPVKLVSLEDLLPAVAREFKGVPLDEAKWVDELLAFGPEKSPTARKIDGLALEWLRHLNVLLHEQWKQLLFVTRGNDIPSVMARHAGGFACLGDAYATSLKDELPPLIHRSWRYLFELGVVWVPNDPEATEANLLERLSEVQTKLEWIEGRKKADAGKLSSGLRQELEDDLQNCLAFLTAERPWLPKGGRPSPTKDVVRLLVRFVTDPDAFRQERDQMREQVRRNLQLLVDELPFVYSVEFVRSAFGEFLPLAKAAVGQLGPQLLVTDVSDCAAASYLRRVYEHMAAAPSPTGTGTVPEPPTLADNRHQLDGVRQVSTALYTLGAFERLEEYRTRHASLIKDYQPLTPGWLIDVLMEVDRLVVENLPSQADGLLYGHWRQVSDLEYSTRRPELVKIVLLNAWMLLHLDLVAPKGENVAEFPRSPEANGGEVIDVDAPAELDGIFEALFESVHTTRRKLGSRLLQSVRNNLLYAAARLAPSYLDVYAPGAEAEAARASRAQARLNDIGLLGYLHYLEANKSSPEHYDTIGYYQTKRLGALEPESTAWYQAAETARDRLEYALRWEAGTVEDRTIRALEQHRLLLSETLYPEVSLEEFKNFQW